MKKSILFLIMIPLIFFSSCQDAKNVADIDFPDGTTLEDTMFWISTSSDPLNIADVISERLGSYGFKTAKIADASSMEDFVFAMSFGSAFAISSDLLVTTSHVVGSAEEVYVTVEGEMIPAEVIHNEVSADVAFLRLVDKSLPFSFSLGSDVPKGTHVYVLGYPMPEMMGREVKLTEGIVSSLSGLEGTLLRTQFTANIQPGNSGGPVFTDDFSVIGVATETISDRYFLDEVDTVSQGVNYAVKADIVKFLASGFISDHDTSSPVSSIEEAAKATFLVSVDVKDDVNLDSDIRIDLSYVYGFHSSSGNMDSSEKNFYFADPLTLSLYSLDDGGKLGEITRSSLESWFSSESIYDTADRIAFDIFCSWAERNLPRSNV